MRFTLMVGQNGELMGHLIASGYTLDCCWLHSGLLLVTQLHSGLLVVTQWLTIGNTMDHYRSYNGSPLMSQ